MSETKNEVPMNELTTPTKSPPNECVTPHNAINDDDSCCSVCLSPLDEKNAEHKGGVTTTRCMHKFHRKCITRAKAYHSSCPMCRANLTPMLTRQRVQGPVSVFNSAHFDSARTASADGAGSQNQNRGTGGVPTGVDIPEGMMSTMICAAASRGRNAVREAMARRNAANAAATAAL